MTTDAGIDIPNFVVVRQTDPLAAPQLAELAIEYTNRYGGDAEEFESPGGVLIVAVSNGAAVAGGAFRRYNATTAEPKRIWTASGQRRRGYGQLVLAELEQIALHRGYTRIYLTTGRRQPEAVALYLAAGYTPLYERSLPSDEIGRHPFEKLLVAG